jgi:hypothetical protein
VFEELWTGLLMRVKELTMRTSSRKRGRGGVVRVAVVALIVEDIFLCPQGESKGQTSWAREVMKVLDKDPVPIEGRESSDL